MIRPFRLARLAAIATGVVLLFGTTTVPATAEPPAPAAPTAQQAVGSWTVERLGGNRYAVTWRSPQRLPISSDRPRVVAGPKDLVSVTSMDRDRRTVRAVVSSTRTLWAADLDVLLSGDRLDVAGRDGLTSTLDPSARRLLPADRQVIQDPATPGPYAVVSSNYVRPSVKLAGMTQPIEMVGHVVEPAPGAATGPRPLVVFLHGRHAYCYQARKGDENYDWPCRGAMAEIPSQLGYDYAQRLLASQGYATVSVRVNGINAQDYALSDGGANARAAIVAQHLNYLTTLATSHRLDLSRVILIGHSRGGEGVNRASIQIPLSAPYRIVGQVLLAPTDFAEQAAPYVPTLTVLPYCDGDVYDLQGQHFTDIARDIAAGDTALRSSVLVMGANHNFFNTQWTPGISVAPSNDDWFGDDKAPCGAKAADRLSAAQQQATGKVFIAAAVRIFAADQQQFLPLLDGSPATVPTLGRAVTLSHAIRGASPDVRRPGREFSLALAQGARTDLCRGNILADFRADVCGSELAYELVVPHWYPDGYPAPARTFWRMRWTAAAQTGGMLLSRPLDLRNRTLDLRTLVDPRQGAVAVDVRLTDSSGASATLVPVGGRTISPLPAVPYATKMWARTVRIDPAGSAIDLARVVRVDLIGRSADGTVYVADLAARTDRLATVPTVRVPRLSVGSATIKEGDRNGWSVGTVPWKLSEPAPTAAQFTVLTVGEQGTPRRYVVNVAPGQRSGVVEVGYQADRLDDQSPVTTEVYILPGPNLMTDVYVGRLTVVDDDPTPTVSVTRPKSSVVEGASAKWRVKLSAALGYDTSVYGNVVKGKGKELTGQDVTKSWFEKHCGGKRTARLSAAGCSFGEGLKSGVREVTVSIPTVRDKVKEGKERVTVRLFVLHRRLTSTVTVKNRS